MPHFKRFEDIKQPGFYFATDIVKRENKLPYRVVVRFDPAWDFIWIGGTNYATERFVDFTGPFVDELPSLLEAEQGYKAQLVPKGGLMVLPPLPDTVSVWEYTPSEFWISWIGVLLASR